MRHVLAIPLEEVRRHFEVNERQSLKVVAPSRLGAEMMARLRAKPEAPLDGDRWRHSTADAANFLCQSAEFTECEGAGFSISFGNERAALGGGVLARERRGTTDGEAAFGRGLGFWAWRGSPGNAWWVDLCHGSSRNRGRQVQRARLSSSPCVPTSLA